MANNPLGGLLGSLFGQDAREEDYRSFDKRSARGRPEDLDDYEVQQRYRQVLRNAPPELIEDAHAEAFSQLDPRERRMLARRLREQAAQLEAPFDDPYDRDEYDDDPRTLARMARRAEQRNPNVLDQLFGGQPGPLNNALVKMAMAGAAAMAARRFLGGQGGRMGGLGGHFGGQNTGFDNQGGTTNQGISNENRFGGTEV